MMAPQSARPGPDEEITVSPDATTASQSALGAPAHGAPQPDGESHGVLRAIVESAPGPVIAIDDDGLIVGWGQGAASAFGWSADEIMGKSLADVVVPPEFRDDVNLGLEQYRYGGEARVLGEVLALSVLHRDSGPFPGELSISRAFSVDGMTTFLAFVGDGTGNAHTEDDLTQATAEWQLQTAITANMSEGVVVVGASDAQILYTNAAFDSMLGYATDGLAGRSFWTLTVDEAGVETGTAIMGILNQEGSWRGEVYNRRQDGTAVWCHANVSTFEHPGHERMWIWVQTDISDSKRLGELTRAARNQAEAVSRVKSDYLSRISHELRSPLTSIIRHAGLLAADQPRDDQRSDVEAILERAADLLVLVTQVLDITGMEKSGAGWLSFESVDMRRVIDECWASLADPAAARKITLQCELSSEVVFADEQRLRQVVLNLMSNAIIFNIEGGSVLIWSQPAADGRVRIAVTDNGPGIAPDRLPLVFEPFERLGAEESTVKGTGLGLAFSEVLVRTMGGSMGVNSEVGRGSTFWIELPRGEVVPAES